MVKNNNILKHLWETPWKLNIFCKKIQIEKNQDAGTEHGKDLKNSYTQGEITFCKQLTTLLD